MKKTILFVRHGQSIANSGERTYGKGQDIVLSAKGFEQAEAAADKLKKPDLIVVSPYLRTVQTARPIMAKFADVTVELWDSVHEFDPLSDAQNHGSTSFEREPMYYEYVAKNDCAHRNGAGAQTFNEFIKRVDDTLDKLRGLDSKNIVVVSHYWFINAVLMRLKSPEVKMTPKYFEDNMTDIKNAEIVKVEL